MTGDIQLDSWKKLTYEFPMFENVKNQMQGAREDRVVTLEKTLNMLIAYKSQDQVTGAFLCGYLTSLIAPGTFDHISLLRPYIANYPTALLWYGLCAGINETNNLANYSGGAGRRIAREAFRKEDIFDRPRCDISMAELEVLLFGEKSGLDFRGGGQNYLEVEIVPCVSAVIRWPQRADTQIDMFNNIAPNDMHKLLSELDVAVSRVNAVQYKIAGLFDNSSKGRFNASQRNISKDKKKKKG